MARRNLVVGLLAVCTNLAFVAAPVRSIAGTEQEIRSRQASAPSAPAIETPTTARVVATLPGNPLWRIPLAQLKATRERPIFSPSRRPPPPVVVAQPVTARPPAPKQEVAPPQLTLVGTIAGEQQSFGLFVGQPGSAAFRLKIGDDYQGWRLQSVLGRGVTMARDGYAALLTLPQPGAASGDVRLVPLSQTATSGAERR